MTSSADLVQIINIGNNMYSALSQSYKQGLLFLTDLPVMVITLATLIISWHTVIVIVVC